MRLSVGNYLLVIPEQIVDVLDFESLERKEQSRRSRIKNEVLIRFDTIYTRDMVQSYATNLASTTVKDVGLHAYGHTRTSQGSLPLFKN